MGYHNPSINGILEYSTSLRYNDGRKIEADKFLQIKKELVRQFGALSVDPHPVEGFWTEHGITCEDVLLKFIVDVAQDTRETRVFFREFKEVLKKRFEQLDVWIVAFPIRII